MFHLGNNLMGRKNKSLEESRVFLSEFGNLDPKSLDFRDLKPNIARLNETINQVDSQGNLYSIIFQLQQEIAELKRKNEELTNKIRKIEKYLKDNHKVVMEDVLKEVQEE